jgi:hypothetical protein
MNTDIIEAQPVRSALATTPTNPASVLVYAMEKGADMAQIEKLLDLQMRWEADQARKAYVADMAEFKKSWFSTAGHLTHMQLWVMSLPPL